jgi:hypothetical protein
MPTEVANAASKRNINIDETSVMAEVRCEIFVRHIPPSWRALHIPLPQS